MKKHQLLLIPLLFVFCAVSAQDEMVPIGNFEDSMSTHWGAYAADAPNGPNDFRVDDIAYEGSYSARIWDHTWGVLLWCDVPNVTDSADYEFSFWYKGDLMIYFDLAMGRDLSYDLVNDPDGIVPDTAKIVDLNTSLNAAIQWTLLPKTDWTYFSYTWGFDDWLGIDPETQDPITASIAFMFENAAYAADAPDGPSMYFDNVSLTKTSRVSTGISKKEVSALQVYPNPTSGLIHIQDGSASGSLQIIDLSGRTVMKINQAGTTVDVSGLNPGVYFLRAVSDTGISSISKFILN